MTLVRRAALGTLGLNVGLALAYYLAARLGLAAAIGPGQVTAVWPPSGLALAAFMVWQWRALPGIAVGSFLLNWLGYLGPVLQMRPEAVGGALLLTSGSLLQAGLAAAWLHRQPIELGADPLRQTLRFGAVVALCCTVAASIGSAGLQGLGVVAPADLAYSWTTWWVGDCAGMLVVTPPLLLWWHAAARRDPISSLTFPIISMGLGFTLMASFIVGHLERDARIDRFRADARALSMTLQNHLDIAQRDLEVVQSFHYKGDIDEQEFDAITGPMLVRSPWQLNFAWLPRITAAQRPAFERSLGGPQGMSLREVDAQERVVRADARPIYLPVRWTAPATGHEALVGVDEAADALRGPAVSRVQGGAIAATPPMHSLARAATDRVVVSFYAPVWDGELRAGEPVPSRLRGLVSATIDLGALLAAVHRTLPRVDTELLLYDPQARTTGSLGGMRWRGEAPEPWLAVTQQEVQARLGEGVHEALSVRVADRTWQLLVQPAWATTLRLPSWLQVGVFVAGLAFTGLLTGLLVARRRRELALQAARDQLEQQVAARTAELAAANHRLQGEVDERRQLEARLRDASARAESANQAKSLFLAHMSHEIRTPLNAVLGYAQLMREDAAPGSTASTRLHTILDAGQRLLRLINDVLDLSKIEAGGLQLRQEAFDLRQELDEAVALLAPRVQAKGLRFEADLALPAGRTVLGDRGKLGQVVLNLLSNALKFTDHGHVGLAAWRGQGTGMGDEQALIFIEVSDSGPGIDAAEQARLFSPFEQGAAGQDKGGTGLGLVVSRHIARAMGGDLVLHSQPGRGTRVRLQVHLPEYLLHHGAKAAEAALHGALNPVVTVEDAATAAPTLDPATPCRVLVVEDDLASRDVLCQALRRTGCEVRDAADGAAGLAACAAGGIDIVLTDIRMPVLDGLTMLQRLRAEPATQALPVVAVSASSLVHERRHYIEAGFQDFVAKPYAFGEIYRVLARHAGVRWQAPGSAAAPGVAMLDDADDPADAVDDLADPMAETQLQTLADAAAAGDLGGVQRAWAALGRAALATPQGQRLSQAVKGYDFEAAEKLARAWSAAARGIST